MKVSVSLPDEDVAYLDEYARSRGVGSRSAALHEAVRSLRTAELDGAYEAAWHEWAESGDADLWAAVSADGVDAGADAAR